jgi:nucleoside-diphosphate-sugar epimerase
VAPLLPYHIIDFMARVLVTGASGFIGLTLVEALLARGNDVRCLVRAKSAVDRFKPLGVELANGNVIDPDALPAATAGVDVVYHLAGITKASSRREYYRVNGDGVRNVIQACARRTTPPVVVVVSSLAAAGPMTDPQRLRVETDPVQPVSQYGLSKRAGELAAEKWGGQVPITIVRPPIVFGPGDRTGFLLFRNIRRYRLYFVFGQGRHFSVIYVSDLAAGLIAAADRGQRLPAPASTALSDDLGNDAAAQGCVSGRGYYFITGEDHLPFSQLNRLIAQSVGRPRAWSMRLPLASIWAVATVTELMSRITRRPDYVNMDRARELTAGHWICSSEKAHRDLGFSSVIPLGQRIEETAQWYRDQGWMKNIGIDLPATAFTD